MIKLIFPTELHEQAAKVIGDFFVQQEHTDRVLLLNS